MLNSRQFAFEALHNIYYREAYADVALNRVLNTSNLSRVDRNLVCELVYGTVRHQRSLDVLIDQLGKKKANQQPPGLRLILHLGLYQLRYLTQIPDSAAVNTSVDLAKKNGLQALSKVVNGLLRQYIRLTASGQDLLDFSTDPVQKLGNLYSFPDWIIELWLEQFGLDKTEALCKWFNQAPKLDLRVNSLKSSRENVESAFREAGIEFSRLSLLPLGLRLESGIGAVQNLPGFQEGWWTIQDSSAQLVSYLLDPQPGEVIIDACAAPGGKTTHIAELMGDNGEIWACDRHGKRLKKIQENAQRLQLRSISLCEGDSRHLSQFTQKADRVLLDAPCSGLGTLHKHPDIRWRQTPKKIEELAQLQRELLERVSTWVKPKGILVYATCTLHPLENEGVIQSFLADHPNWQIQSPSFSDSIAMVKTSSNWLKILPDEQDMDGFFMVKLKQEYCE